MNEDMTVETMVAVRKILRPVVTAYEHLGDILLFRHGVSFEDEFTDEEWSEYLKTQEIEPQ